MKINIFAIVMLLVIASCTKPTQPQTPSNNMSEISFDYQSPIISGTYYVNADFVNTIEGNAAGVNLGTQRLVITSLKDANTMFNLQNTDIDDCTKTSKIEKGLNGGQNTSGGISAMFSINGVGYLTAFPNDSITVDYTIANNKLNGTFNARLSSGKVVNGVPILDSIVITNGKFIDVPIN